MAGFVLMLHVVGWGTLLMTIVPARYELGVAGTFGVGLGFTAYLLGARHAFDADHIAAIDNTIRKLASEGRRPLSVGFWFSLGHSSIVFLLCLLLGFGVRAVAGQVANDSSTLQNVTAVIGTAVSGTFLLLIGLMNLNSLRAILALTRRMRSGQLDDAELNRQLDARGLLARVLGWATRAVRKPWQMYPVGLLFGLGFDTATEVSLLVLAGGTAAFELPWYAVLTLPVLFAAGMSLLDAADGVFMTAAYEWALDNPVRRVFYNFVMTALSVAVALVIGAIELIGLLAGKLDIRTGPVAWIAEIDLENVGFVVVGVFALTWLTALGYWRIARPERVYGR